MFARSLASRWAAVLLPVLLSSFSSIGGNPSGLYEGVIPDGPYVACVDSSGVFWAGPAFSEQDFFAPYLACSDGIKLVTPQDTVSLRISGDTLDLGGRTFIRVSGSCTPK